jgi:hypothetical protein
MMKMMMMMMMMTTTMMMMMMMMTMITVTPSFSLSRCSSRSINSYNEKSVGFIRLCAHQVT